MVGWLSLVQRGQGAGFPGSLARAAAQRPGTARLSSIAQGAPISSRIPPRRGGSRRRSERLDLCVRAARALQASVLCCTNAGGVAEIQSLDGFAISNRTRQTLAPAESRHLDR